MQKVLVFDGRSRAALSIIRSLGKKGFYVIAGEAFKSSSFYSKYTTETLLYPPPDKEPDAFLKFISNFLKENKIDFVIPVRDHITELFIFNRSKLIPLTRFELAPKNAFVTARDKSETIKIARKLGIPHPKTIITSGEIPSLELLKKEFILPFLIKPRISSGSRGIKMVRNWHEYEDKFKQVNEEFPKPLIQEFIPHGGAYGVSMLYKKGIPKASFTHKRIREFPLTGGPSTLREGVSYPEIENYAKKLLTELNWNGVAMVEYRIDSRSNMPKLMEINPRFWGSLETAVFSGVDFPYLLFNLGINNEADDCFEYKLGKRVRWLFLGDILWFLSSPKTISNLNEFFKFYGKNLGYDIFSWRDIGPTFGAIYEGLRSFFKKERRLHALKRGW